MLAVLIVALGGCGKTAEPAPQAASASTEDHAVSVPPPSADAGAVAPAANTPTAVPVAAVNPAPAPGAEEGEAQPKAAAAAPENGAGTPAATSEVPEKIARVGDVVITAQEFTRDLAQRAAMVSKEQGQQVNPDDPGFRALALGEMIDARVLRSVATKAVTVTDEEVNREYDRGKRVLGSDGKFQEYLKHEGLDEAGLKALLRDRIAIQTYRKQKLDEAAVTEDETRKLYEDWSAAGRFDRKERTADIQHLAVHAEGSEPADKEKAKQAVEAARARIAGGESFEQVAMEVSDDKNASQTGGLYHEVTAASLPPFVAERIFKQTPGELSEAFEGDNAWHLVKVLGVNEPGKVTLEKAHDQIRKYLLEIKRQDAVAKAVDQAKFLVDIEIYKAELRPKSGPGSRPVDTDTPAPQLKPPARSPENYQQAAPKAPETKEPAAQ